MIYCTQEDLFSRFGEGEIAAVTDRSNSSSPVVDDDVLNDAISDASKEIDGWLLGKFIVPTPPPEALVLICCDITRWLLYDDSLDEDTIIHRRYEKSIATLKSIAAGDFVIDGLVPIDGDGANVRFIRA